MPRITLLRLLLLPPLCWLLLVVLWVSLPSPTHSWDKYPSHRWHGGTLTRVYDVDDWWQINERNSQVRYVRASGRDLFALDVSYDPDAGSLLVGWERAPDVPEARFHLAPEPEPFVSAPFLAHVRLGVRDGINMPWFTRADATLLSFEVDHRTGYLPLRLHAKKGLVEGEVLVSVWAYSGERPMSYSIESANYTNWEAPDWETPLLRFLVTFKSNGPLTPTAVPVVHIEFPTAKPSWSPSLTFPIRRAIGKVIIPTSQITVKAMTVIVTVARVLCALVIATFEAFIFTVGLYVTLVLACWKSKGTPPFWPWASSFWLTRRVVRYIGPAASSSLDSKSDNDGDGHTGESNPENSEDEGPRTPQPLTSIWGFFTSKSPLDDLLVTFQVTRPFVQPLSLRWRRQPAPIDDEEKKSPAASSAVGGHADGNSTRSRNASLHHEAKAGILQEKGEEKLPM